MQKKRIIITLHTYLASLPSSRFGVSGRQRRWASFAWYPSVYEVRIRGFRPLADGLG